ncbi:uncharacterized protein [Cherax quadricarinatus]|nr:uncharacterized protein LOC128699316 [Cherax quadricarinatus]
MKPMYLLVLLCVYLVKVESAVTDQPPLDETAGTDEGSGNYEQLDEFALNDTLADRAVCRFHDACQDAGGVCTSSCRDSGEISRRNCGPGCRCCAASSSKCTSKPICRRFGGACQKAACKANQLQLPSGCLTSSCRCCVSGTVHHSDEINGFFPIRVNEENDGTPQEELIEDAAENEEEQ